ncbi:unnamed protein product [Jaminaea pallidilutea]
MTQKIAVGRAEEKLSGPQVDAQVDATPNLTGKAGGRKTTPGGCVLWGNVEAEKAERDGKRRLKTTDVGAGKRQGSRVGW